MTDRLAIALDCLRRGVSERATFALSVFAVLLSGCAPLPAPTAEFRDQEVAIASTTRFDEERFAGTWFVIADFNENPLPVVREALGPAMWVFEPRQGKAIGIAVCCTYPVQPQPYKEVGPARFEPTSSLLRKQPPIWILWVDESFRTAVVGTQSGSFGAILNRTPDLRADRLQAAKDVLAFNGYDLRQLRTKR